MRKLLKTYQNAEPDSPDSISFNNSSSPELHVPQPRWQKKQPASTTTKPQKPDAKVIGWVDGITSQAPPEDPYEFRSFTPSPELPAYLQPPTYAPPSSHSPPSPSPPPDSQLPRNQLLNTIRQLEKKVNTLTERSVTLTKLVQQYEHLIHLVQELLDKQPQTASRPLLPLHRPWNVTPYLYTDPGMSPLTSTQTLECHTLPLHRPLNVTPYLYTDPGMSPLRLFEAACLVVLEPGE
jgi:hypothetical protein